MNSAPRSCFRLPPPALTPAAATTDLATAAGASGRGAEEAGEEATPPAMEEARARPENQEVEAGGEVITAAARLTAQASGGGWRLRAALLGCQQPALEAGRRDDDEGVEIDWN